MEKLKYIPLEKITQIEIIKAVKELILTEQEEGFFCSGLCNLIKREIINKGIEIWSINEIINYIPLFTYYNAVLHSDNFTLNSFWWTRTNFEDRIKFLDWMLEELHKQLK